MPDKNKDRMNQESSTDEGPEVDVKPSDPGARDFHVRGRPQAELYASEHSLPSEDPLLADLVAGRVSENPMYSDEFSLETDGVEADGVDGVEADSVDTIRNEPRPLMNPGDPQPELRRPVNRWTIGVLVAVAIAAVFLVFAFANGASGDQAKTGVDRLIVGDDESSAKSAEEPARASP